jgi:hypothetical protein
MNFSVRLGGFTLVALLLAAGTTIPGETVAQTATNLKCKGCVGKKDLGKKAVKSKHIRKNQITGAHIKDGRVAAQDLGDDAKPAGIDSVETAGGFGLSGPAEIIDSVVVSAPGPGTILATGGLTASLDPSSGFYCEVTTGSVTGTQSAKASVAGSSQTLPISNTRAIPVAAAGNVTVNFVCDLFAGSVNVSAINLTALFVPGSY